MDELIDKMKAGMASDASPEARAAGAAACRCVLAMIDPQPAPSVPANLVPQVVGMLKGMDLDQLLGVAVDRLRALNAARGDIPPAKPRSIAFQLVPIPRAPHGAP